MTFLFATAIDSGAPILPGGRRVDQMDRSGHYARWAEDLALARSLGVDAVRYGPAYYRTHLGPDHYDWGACDEPLRGLCDLGLEVIADLCRFGPPSWLAGFQDPAFPVLFAEYARAFVRRYPWVRFYTPVHEIFTCALRSGLDGRWNDAGGDEASFVRTLRNLCMAHELAVEAILAERPDAVIVQSEALEQFHASGAAALREAERWNALKLLALDLTLGHEPAPGMSALLHDHGVTSNDLTFFRERRAVGQRWLGVGYGPASEHRVAATGRRTVARSGAGLRRVAAQYWQRYQVPLFHAGTCHIARQATDWLVAQWEDVVALRGAGVPVHGFTWSPLTDVADWERPESMRAVGLFDAERRERPVGARYRELIARWRAVVRGDRQARRGARA
jgi:beta-glucosidase/6-phospho-beta-glucosidase/beta-galactosidase